MAHLKDKPLQYMCIYIDYYTREMEIETFTSKKEMQEFRCKQKVLSIVNEYELKEYIYENELGQR